MGQRPHRAPQGLVTSAWKRDNGSIIWSVIIPKEATALVELPAFTETQIHLNRKSVGRNVFDLTSGTQVITLAEERTPLLVQSRISIKLGLIE